MRTIAAVSGLALVLFLAVPAAADPVVPFGDNGVGLQGVLDGITLFPNPGESSVNVLEDGVLDAYDSYWSVQATGGSVSTIVVEIAALSGTNTFGLYDAADSSKRVQVFAGSDSAGAQKTVSIDAWGKVYVNYVYQNTFAGNLFGFYLYNPTNGYGGPAYFFSDSTLNIGGEDHMAAYQGEGDIVQIDPWAPGKWTADEYVLAWEDWRPYSGPNSSDRDFTDFVVMVESVCPIPEPTTVLLLGCALGGLGLLARRRRRHREA